MLTSLDERERGVRRRRSSAFEVFPGVMLTNSAVVATISQARLELRRLESARLGGHSHDDRHDLGNEDTFFVASVPPH